MFLFNKGMGDIYMLCLGTFLTAIRLCKVSSVGMQTMVEIMMKSIYTDFEQYSDNSLCSNLVRGIKNPPDYVYEALNVMKNDYKIIRDRLADGDTFLDLNREDELRKIIIKIVEEDVCIKDNVIVELYSGTKKADLRAHNKDIFSFLTGIFVYVLKNTDNKMKREDVRCINEDYLDEAQKEVVLVNKSIEKVDVEPVTMLATDDVSTEARKFCAKYETDISLLPLAQIAFCVDPIHNNVRQMYTDFCLCTEKVRREIIRLKELPWIETDGEWIDKTISKIDKDMQDKGYITRSILYEGAKYFHRAFLFYSDERIKEYSPQVFELLDKTYVGLLGPYNDLEKYVGDYFYFKEVDPDRKIIPPGDYMWDVCNLGSCPESEMTFWVCKFIIVCCTRISFENKEIQNVIDVEDDLWDIYYVDYNKISTMEDLYYYALYWLYYTYVA